MSLKINHEGDEYEFVGYLSHPGTMGATHYLAYDGSLKVSTAGKVSGTAHFRLIPKRHTIGGIVYKETGEKRATTFEEWFLNNAGYPEIWHQDRNSTTQYTILRPVKVIDGQDD